MKWASWANALLGAWLIIAPWVLGYFTGAATANDVVLGILILAVAIWSASVPSQQTGPAWANIVFGVWLIFAPWILGYGYLATGAATNDVVVGIMTIIFAAIRLTTARRVVV